ncbi:MAG TPA: alpha/beta hydrolase fold domain-containing protein [Candidatus Saccharimonadales bacterium]
MEVLFLNGLTNGKTRRREQLAFGYLARRGINVTHHGVDWFSGDSFETLRHDATEAARELLQQKGRLAIVGSSAGGSMAMDVFSELQDENVRVISLCGRLHPGDYDPASKLSLESAAHLGTPQASQSFYDSVTYCDQIAIPAVKDENLHKITVIKQLTDLVVPRETMDIAGVKPIVVPGFGHGMGIALATMKLAEILTRHE